MEILKSARVVSSFEKKGSRIEELVFDGNHYIRKTYLHQRGALFAQREFTTIREINLLLKQHGWAFSSYQAVSVDGSSLLMQKVQGVPLDRFLQRHSRSKKHMHELHSQLQLLGKIFRVVQEEYRQPESLSLTKVAKNLDVTLPHSLDDIKGPDWLFCNRKIFAAAADNFIVHEQGITPIDLGSKDETLPNLLQVARFLNFLSISGCRPQHILVIDWKRINALEHAFLVGYFGHAPTSAQQSAVDLFKLSSWQDIVTSNATGFFASIKNTYLSLFAKRNIRMIKKKFSHKEQLLQISKDIGSSLNWSFYKADIVYPHVCADIDVVCEEDEQQVTPVLKKLGFKKHSSLTFQRGDILLHFHYGMETHTNFLFRDIGPFILNHKICSSKGLYRPSYPAWLAIRALFFIKKPRAWLVKQFRRARSVFE